MICYFSATGNCKHVAERIAEATGDRAVSIEGLEPEIQLSEGEVLGLVTPVYFWELPIPMSEFLERANFKMRPSYTYLVVTYGTRTGCSSGHAGKLLKQKGIGLDAAFSIRMPDTWTPDFDLTDKEATAE
jgi:flavodoxin